MRFIIRKFIDADDAVQALAKEKDTPVHDVYLREGEEPKKEINTYAVGFRMQLDPNWRDDEIRAKKN